MAVLASPWEHPARSFCDANCSQMTSRATCGRLRVRECTCRDAETEGERTDEHGSVSVDRRRAGRCLRHQDGHVREAGTAARANDLEPTSETLVGGGSGIGLERSERWDCRPGIRLSGLQESDTHNLGFKESLPQLGVNRDQPLDGRLSLFGLRHGGQNNRR